MSLLDTLAKSVYLDYVLKVLGIVLFALALFKGWHSLGLFNKFLIIAGPVAWFVGDKFNKVYR